MNTIHPTALCIPLIAVVLIAFSAIAEADNGLPTMLPNCEGVPANKPSEVVFACGDYSIVAQKLQWSSWGGYYARASGVLIVNDLDCSPDCAAGHFHSYKVSLTAYGKQHCPDGEIAYQSVKYLIIGGGPEPVARGGSGDFPCRPRP
jgi:hypothetical protein